MVPTTDGLDNEAFAATTSRVILGIGGGANGLSARAMPGEGGASGEAEELERGRDAEGWRQAQTTWETAGQTQRTPFRGMARPTDKDLAKFKRLA